MNKHRFPSYLGKLPAGTMPFIQATELKVPDAWAVMEQNMIRVMEDASDLKIKRYTEPGGAPYFADAIDDLWEMFF